MAFSNGDRFVKWSPWIVSCFGCFVGKKSAGFCVGFESANHRVRRLSAEKGLAKNSSRKEYSVKLPFLSRHRCCPIQCFGKLIRPQPEHARKMRRLRSQIFDTVEKISETFSIVYKHGFQMRLIPMGSPHHATIKSLSLTKTYLGWTRIHLSTTKSLLPEPPQRSPSQENQRHEKSTAPNPAPKPIRPPRGQPPPTPVQGQTPLDYYNNRKRSL